MIVPTKELYLKAREGGYAVGAFNVSNIETIKAIILAASELNAPVVIETSEKEMKFLGAKICADVVRDLAENLDIPVGIHLDHGQNLESVKEAIEAGYTSVHIDASDQKFEDNVETTKEVVEYAHLHGVTVEGEVGHVAGASELHQETAEIRADSLTNPGKAVEFVEKTGVDVLASAIGNIHGIYAKEPKLDFDRLKRIGEIGIPLSLHGGSGIPKNQIEEAISLGIAKVNVNTELRMAFTNTLRRELNENPEEIVPYRYLPEEIEAVKELVEEKIRMFGSMNKA